MAENIDVQALRWSMKYFMLAVLGYISDLSPTLSAESWIKLWDKTDSNGEILWQIQFHLYTFVELDYLIVAP